VLIWKPGKPQKTLLMAKQRCRHVYLSQMLTEYLRILPRDSGSEDGIVTVKPGIHMN